MKGKESRTEGNRGMREERGRRVETWETGEERREAYLARGTPTDFPTIFPEAFVFAVGFLSVHEDKQDISTSGPRGDRRPESLSQKNNSPATWFLLPPEAGTESIVKSPDTISPRMPGRGSSFFLRNEDGIILRVFSSEYLKALRTKNIPKHLPVEQDMGKELSEAKGLKLYTTEIASVDTVSASEISPETELARFTERTTWNEPKKPEEGGGGFKRFLLCKSISECVVLGREGVREFLPKRTMTGVALFFGIRRFSGSGLALLYTPTNFPIFQNESHPRSYPDTISTNLLTEPIPISSQYYPKMELKWN